MRLKPVLTSFVIFSLSIISTTFVLLTLTSSRWSVQKYYVSLTGDPSLGQDWVKPICYATRSPFYRCDLPNINETASPMTCALNCQFYAPYGYDKTSCRLAVETNGTDVNGATTAGELECQQGKLGMMSLFRRGIQTDARISQYTTLEISKSQHQYSPSSA